MIYNDHLDTRLAEIMKESWAEHVFISTGIRAKYFKHPIPINFFKNGGNTFKDVKPMAFHTVDNIVEKWTTYPFPKNPLHVAAAFEMIKFADNRMIMGDFRYGLITRQDLSGYDTKKEYNIRIELAYSNKSLEYLIDAYNMCRIQFLKDNDYASAYEKARFLSHVYSVHKISDNWSLNSVDDGYHAEEIK